jgi:hypothetical protein
MEEHRGQLRKGPNNIMDMWASHVEGIYKYRRANYSESKVLQPELMRMRLERLNLTPMMMAIHFCPTILWLYSWGQRRNG